VVAQVGPGSVEDLWSRDGSLTGARAHGPPHRPDPVPGSGRFRAPGAARRSFFAAGRLLRRDRLHALLDSALDGPWAVLAAPAGCGKSSLLASWLAEVPAGIPISLITTGDVAAQLRAGPGHLASGTRGLLVVDHRDSLSRSTWRRLAERAEDGSTTVVVATRVDPPLPLGRLAISGELVEIRAGDLRWTEHEMRALLRHSDLDLDEKATDLLRARTAGWSAGLRLAISGMTRAEDPYEFLTRFGEDDHATVDYLAQEVFAALPERLRELLAATSDTADLTAASAAAVSGLPDAGPLLDDLVDEGLLCTADDEDIRHYRYHPLLLSLLRRRTEVPGRLARRRAAHWHATHARPAAAVVDASYTGDHDLTARLVQEHGADLLGDEAGRQSLGQALSSLPPDWSEEFTPLLPCSGLLEVLAGDQERATQILTAAEDRMDRSWSAGPRYDLLALRAWAAARGWRDPVRCVAEVAELGYLRLDPPGLAGETDLARESLLLGRLGVLLAWHGGPRPAAALLEVAVRSGRGARRMSTARGPIGVGPFTREAMAVQALLLAANGQARTAAAMAQEVLAAPDDSALAEGSTAIARLAAAWSGYLRGLPGEARTQLTRAEAGLAAAQLPAPELLAAILRARLVLPGEGPAAARAALQGVGGRLAGAPAWIRALWATTELRIAAVVGEFESALAVATRELPPGGAELAVLSAVLAFDAGDPAAAREQLRPVLSGEAPVVIPWTALRASHTDAAAAHVLGDLAGAAQGVVRTLVLGAAEEQVVPLGELSGGIPGLLDLLDAYPQASGVAGAPRYLSALRDRLPAITASGPLPSALEPVRRGAVRTPPPGLPAGADADPAVLAGARTLTDRELDVLGRLDSVLPLNSIAEGMYVTLNTLKTHVGAIYRKLGADSRADAVQRAQDLGLISRR
jgi:LuxR family transcriptional regulator, maltose regulon positive regulatory protein